VVTYATDLKVGLLAVPQHLVTEHGVVSAECAQAMAEGVRRLVGSTYALSTTGVAGPDWAEGHPPGTAFVGVATPSGGCDVLELSLSGDRGEVQDAVCLAALTALRGVLPEEQAGLG
jgi:PncC family amidohydrolase